MNAGKPQLKSRMQAGPHVLGPYGQKATRDIADPGSAPETVFVTAFHDIFLVGEWGRLPAANAEKQIATCDGRREEVYDRLVDFADSLDSRAHQHSIDVQADHIGAEVGLFERGVALVVQSHADAPVSVPSGGILSRQKAHADLSSTVDGRTNDHPLAARCSETSPSFLGPAKTTPQSEMQPAVQCQINMRQCGHLSADVLWRSSIGGDYRKSPTGLVTVSGPKSKRFAVPRQFTAQGMPFDESANDRAVWHQKSCTEAG